MIQTNLLLSIGFSLVSNFTNVVPVRPEAVPTKIDDLKHYVVGSPNSPIHLYLVDRQGTEFWLDGGVVYSYRTSGS
jgi:hypothetical protein